MPGLPAYKPEAPFDESVKCHPLVSTKLTELFEADAE